MSPSKPPLKPPYSQQRTKNAFHERKDHVRAYFHNTRTANTDKAYTADWSHFEAWCRQHGLPALPAAPPTVMLYLSELSGAGKRLSTISRRLAALAQVHRSAGFDSPSEHRGVGELLSGMRRTHGTASHGKEALLSEDLRAIVPRTGRLATRHPGSRPPAGRLRPRLSGGRNWWPSRWKIWPLCPKAWW